MLGIEIILKLLVKDKFIYLFIIGGVAKQISYIHWMDSVINIGAFVKVSIFTVHESCILCWALVSVLIFAGFIKRYIIFMLNMLKKLKTSLFEKKNVRLFGKKKLKQKAESI